MVDSDEEEYAKDVSAYDAQLKTIILEKPRTFLLHLEQKKVLDVGCSKRGSALPRVYASATSGVEITYLDGILEELEPLQAPEERKVWANACQMPFPDERFDLVHMGCFPISEIVRAEPDDLRVIEVNAQECHIKVPRFKSPPQIEPSGWGGRAQYFAVRESCRVLRKGGVLTFYVVPEADVSKLVLPIKEIRFSGLEMLLPETEYIDAKLYAAKKN